MKIRAFFLTTDSRFFLTIGSTLASLSGKKENILNSTEESQGGLKHQV